MALTQVIFSGSTNGRMIEVSATSTPGTTVHAAHASSQDSIYLFATNASASAEELTVEFGGTTSTDDLIIRTVAPRDGLILIVPGIPLTGSVVVRAFAGSANVINVTGWIVRDSG